MSTFRKLLLCSAVLALWMGMGGCTEFNPLFDGFGGFQISRDGGVRPDLSGPCAQGEARLCYDCNGQPQIQRCLGETWGDCPCPPDMRAPVDMASLPDLGMVQDRQPAPDLVILSDLAPVPDLAMECRPGEVQACVVCQAVGTKTCDVNGKFGACMPPKPVDCLAVGSTRPYQDQYTCSTNVVQTCEANCTWGKPHLKTVPDGCGICDPIDGVAGCGGVGDTCGAMKPKCSFYFEPVCAMGAGKFPPIGEGDVCGTDWGPADRCDRGLACNPDDQRCRRVCDLANPMCPRGRTCKPASNQSTKCYGYCVP